MPYGQWLVTVALAVAPTQLLVPNKTCQGPCSNGDCVKWICPANVSPLSPNIHNKHLDKG